MPQCTILAGPNGSGKSSIYAKLQPPGLFINVDEIARELPDDMDAGARRVRAGRLAIEEINSALASHRDFCFETTLSSRHALSVMRRAQAAGFQIGPLYVILASPELNVARVRFRVQNGGHDIPDEDVVRRYNASLKHLPAALRLADEYIVIDNSPAQPIFLFEGRSNQYLDLIDYNPEVPLHRRLFDALRTTFASDSS